MSHQIEFENDGRVAVSEHGESVLESAIRSGLSVNYGCSNGNCGLCLARLVEGDVEQIHHYDYRLSRAERQEGKFLMCAHTPTRDLVLRVDSAQSGLAVEPQTFSAKVRSVKTVSERVRIVTLQPSRSVRLRFSAGQYARVTADAAAFAEYAIASCPCDARRVEFHVDSALKNDFCDYVFNHCMVGDVCRVEAPFGKFVFSEDMSKPLIFIAFGSGFAAIKSLLEHVTAQDSEIPIHLYWIAREGEHYLDNLCCAWNDALDQLSYRCLTLADDSDEASSAFFSEVLDEHRNLPVADVYCCAPDKVLAALSENALQLPESWQFFYERIPLKNTPASDSD